MDLERKTMKKDIVVIEKEKNIIYDNYDLSDNYDFTKEDLIEENGCIPSDDEIWDRIYFNDRINWEDEHSNLKNFFDCKGKWIIFGFTQRWNGKYQTAYVFSDFDDAFCKATKDCDYFRIHDANGHLYITCSHHDGTNMYEIKKLTSKGESYLENWENNFNDNRTEEYVHNQIIENYSIIPRYFSTIYKRKIA